MSGPCLELDHTTTFLTPFWKIGDRCASLTASLRFLVVWSATRPKGRTLGWVGLSWVVKGHPELDLRLLPINC